MKRIKRERGEGHPPGEAEETLRALAECARALTGARFAVVAAPGPDGALRVRASAGDAPGGCARAAGLEASGAASAGGPGGRAFREGRPVVVDESDADTSFVPWREEAARRGIGAAAFVPVRFRGEVLGVLGVSLDRPGAWSGGAVGALETLAGLAGSALGFAAQAARLERRVDDLAVFERVGRFITPLAGERETLDHLAGQVREALRCDAVLVRLLDDVESDRRRAREVRHVPDLGGDGGVPEPLRLEALSLQLRAGYVVSLVAGGEVLGHMVAAFRDAHPFRAEEARALAILGDRAAVVAANARVYDRARLEAHVDSLTGLWNHRSLLRFLSHETAAARFSGRELSLIFIDLDGFKAINDGWGHPEGDALLREMAGVIRRTVPEGCYACRYGGDEFAVVQPGAGREEAMRLAERLRAAIAEAGRRFIPPGACPVTSSIGVACFPGDAQSVSGLVGAADHAMYAAKTAGRNRVCASGALAG